MTLTLRLALALVYALLLARPTRKRSARQAVRQRVDRWRETAGDAAVGLSLIPLNLPGHAPMTIAEQAAWVAGQMANTDVATIAECPPELAAAIDRRKGLRCHAARPNLGGNGNAIVVNTDRVDDVSFSQYRVTYTATSGARFVLNMVRARIVKDGLVSVVDGIHAPSRPGPKRYRTEASDAQRRRVFRAIARHRPKDYDVWLLAGDTNWLVRQVVEALRSVSKRWRHLGGSGVEQVYGRGPVVHIGQRVVRYLRASDHKVTARVRLGARKLLGQTRRRRGGS